MHLKSRGCSRYVALVKMRLWTSKDAVFNMVSSFGYHITNGVVRLFPRRNSPNTRPRDGQKQTSPTLNKYLKRKRIRKALQLSNLLVVMNLQFCPRGHPNIKHGPSHISWTKWRVEVELGAIKRERRASINKRAIDDRPKVDGG